MKFIVDRRTWFRGQGSDESLLLNRDGQRCCIGFVGAQCGINDTLLLGIPDVFRFELKQRITGGIAKKFPPWLRFGGAASKAYNLNDCKILSETERETGLQKLFAENGDEIVFEN